MFNVLVSIELTNLVWSSDWNGDEVGYPESEIVGLYSQEREDGSYSFYIDVETNKVLEFWKDEEMEAEVKKDLKEAILGIEVTQFDGQKADLEELVNPRQLEEVINDWMPEVLSQEWIDEHAKAVAYDGMPDQTEVVYVDDLQNLLVPKQELPAIPKFVADYLDLAKSEVTLMRVLELANTRNELPKWEKEYDWISANEEKFARSWLDGYKVEEEPRYYVLNGEGETMIRKSDSRVRTSSGFKIKNGFKGENYKFTEQEIKDYDERYIPFMVPVDEVNND